MRFDKGNLGCNAALLFRCLTSLFTHGPGLLKSALYDPHNSIHKIRHVFFPFISIFVFMFIDS